MEISPLTLFVLLITSFLLGGFIGVINDINKMLRVFLCGEEDFDRYKKMADFFRLKKNVISFNKTFLNAVMFIQDIFTLTFSTVGLILLNYYYNDGYFRFFSFFAMVVGFVIYYFTLGKLAAVILESLAFFLRCIIVTIVRIITYPIILLIKCIKKLIIKSFIKYKKHIEKNKNLRYNKERREMILELSKCGFIINDVKKV
jgi:Mg2+/Co2+ transporter CorB